MYFRKITFSKLVLRKCVVFFRIQLNDDKSECFDPGFALFQTVHVEANRFALGDHDEAVHVGRGLVFEVVLQKSAILYVEYASLSAVIFALICIKSKYEKLVAIREKKRES